MELNNMFNELKGVKVWILLFKVKAKAYQEPSRASMRELYCENSNQLKAIFPKSWITDVRMGSKYVSEKSQDEGKAGKIVPIVTTHSFSCFFLFWHNPRPLAKVETCLLGKIIYLQQNFKIHRKRSRRMQWKKWYNWHHSLIINWTILPFP